MLELDYAQSFFGSTFFDFLCLLDRFAGTAA